MFCSAGHTPLCTYSDRHEVTGRRGITHEPQTVVDRQHARVRAGVVCNDPACATGLRYQQRLNLEGRRDALPL